MTKFMPPIAVVVAVLYFFGAPVPVITAALLTGPMVVVGIALVGVIAVFSWLLFITWKEGRK